MQTAWNPDVGSILNLPMEHGQPTHLFRFDINAKTVIFGSPSCGMIDDDEFFGCFIAPFFLKKSDSASLNCLFFSTAFLVPASSQ